MDVTSELYFLAIETGIRWASFQTIQGPKEPTSNQINKAPCGFQLYFQTLYNKFQDLAGGFFFFFFLDFSPLLKFAH